MVGRIVRPADFQRILATRPVARSARFVVHHLHDAPSKARSSELSTALSTGIDRSAGCLAPGAQWFGLVVPKRHAKRAVTRSLLKRQMRQVFLDAAAGLDAGLWLIRLKAPFDRSRFPSAASDALRLAARSELGELFVGVGAVPCLKR